ncbi:MAG: hypothetical protein ALAOOOJD_00111 [bacterium]|nr:hypothetical protein [bacterium]
MKKYSSYAGAFGLLLVAAGLLSYLVRTVWQWQEIVSLSVGGALLLFYLVFNAKELIGFVSSRGALQTANAVVMSILVIGLLALANYLASKHAWRKDTTASGQFSLSDQTKKVLTALKTDLSVTAFYRVDEKAKLADLLNEYASVTPKFKYEFVDPDKKPELARTKGVTAYNTTVVAYGVQSEKITTATEEDLTNAIIKVTRDKKKKIYFTTNHGEKAVDSEERLGLSAAQKAITAKNYDVGSVSLIDTAGVPADCSVLVIAGAQTDFLPPELQKVKKYLDNGGAAMFLLDAGLMTSTPVPTFSELLKDYGIQPDNDMVLDFSGIGQLFGAGPDMPVVASYSKHAITEKFGSFMTAYPSARSLTVMSEKPAGVTVEAFASSSGNSWGESNPEELRSGRVQPNVPPDHQGPLPLGVAATKSAAADGANGAKNSRVVVFGDSDFAANYLFGFQKNGDLFMNAVSWLAEEEDLIAIPAKNPEDRRLNMNASSTKVVMLVSLFLLPLAAFGTAIAVYVKRK